MNIKLAISSHELEKFSHDGYLIVENAFTKDDLLAFKKCLLRIIQIALNKYNISFSERKEISIAEKCDRGLIALRMANPDYPLFVQACISRSPEYYRLCSSSKIVHYLQRLYSSAEDSPIYSTNNGIIFTNPNDSLNQRSSNIEIEWHKDTFYTVPKSHFLHTWAPVLHHATESIGTLQVCPGSHKEGLGMQLINPKAAYDHRYIVDPASITKYQPLSIEVKLGQALIFDGRLIHRSGKNISQHVRCTLIGLNHAVTNPNFQPLSVSYSYTNQTPEAYFYEIFKDDKAVPLLHEQALPTKA